MARLCISVASFFGLGGMDKLDVWCAVVTNTSRASHTGMRIEDICCGVAASAGLPGVTEVGLS